MLEGPPPATGDSAHSPHGVGEAWPRPPRPGWPLHPEGPVPHWLFLLPGLFLMSPVAPGWAGLTRAVPTAQPAVPRPQQCPTCLPHGWGLGHSQAAWRGRRGGGPREACGGITLGSSGLSVLTRVAEQATPVAGCGPWGGSWLSFSPCPQGHQDEEMGGKKQQHLFQELGYHRTFKI